MGGRFTVTTATLSSFRRSTDLWVSFKVWLHDQCAYPHYYFLHCTVLSDDDICHWTIIFLWTLLCKETKQKSSCHILQNFTNFTFACTPDSSVYFKNNYTLSIYSKQVDDKLYIYLEYVSGGSIHKLLQEYGQFGEPAIRSYTKQILLGLAYLHAKNTVHR